MSGGFTFTPGTMALHIRLASIADLPSLIKLEQSAPTAAHWSSQQYRTAVASDAEGRVTLVAEEDSNLLGFLVTRAIDKEWEIENIVVAEESRRRGVARQMFNEFLNLARQHSAQAIFLEVRESNLPARRFYEKNGFSERGRRKNYYHSPQEDAIIYRLALQ